MIKLEQGDHVKLRYKDRVVDAEVHLASRNGHSLALRFEAILGPYVGWMAVIGDTPEGPFRDLLGEPVGIAIVER